MIKLLLAKEDGSGGWTTSYQGDPNKGIYVAYTQIEKGYPTSPISNVFQTNLYGSEQSRLVDLINNASYNRTSLNGTLFYCLEYYLFLKQYIKYLKFYIVDISEQDLKLVYDVFYDKYKKEYIDNLKIIQVKRTEIFSLNLDTLLALDTKTAKHISPFFKNRFLVFCDNIRDLKKSDNMILYGSYNNYQVYDKYQLLKLGLHFQKKYENKNNKVFISCPDFNKIQNFNEIDFNKILNKENYKIYKKKHNKFYKNLFKEVNDIIYIHVELDTNNRIIPEAFYHDVKLYIIDYSKSIIDSITQRYNDIKQNGIQNYIINKNDIIIQDMLN